MILEDIASFIIRHKKSLCQLCNMLSVEGGFIIKNDQHLDTTHCIFKNTNILGHEKYLVYNTICEFEDNRVGI